MNGFTVWFTGLSCSGKSTLAKMLRDRLDLLGLPVELLDSGKIRRELETDRGFTSKDIEHNLNRISYECQLLNRNGVVAVVGAISPYRAHRDAVRARVGHFVEVFCDAPLEVLEERDQLGIFEKARRGELSNVAGVDTPYEPPANPEVHVRTDTLDPDTCTERILTVLNRLGLVDSRAPAAYTDEEKRLIETRLKDVGYS